MTTETPTVRREAAALILQITPETLDKFKLPSLQEGEDTLYDAGTIAYMAAGSPASATSLFEVIESAKARGFGELISTTITSPESAELTFERGTMSSGASNGIPINRTTRA